MVRLRKLSFIVICLKPPLFAVGNKKMCVVLDRGISPSGRRRLVPQVHAHKEYVSKSRDFISFVLFWLWRWLDGDDGFWTGCIRRLRMLPIEG